MSKAATKEDIRALEKNLSSEIRNSYDDLVAIMGTFMTDVDSRFIAVEAVKDELDRIFTYLDSIVKKQSITDDEILVVGRQLSRLDRWTHELANDIGYTLKHD